MKLLKILITFLILLIFSKTFAYYYDEYKNYDKSIRINTFSMKLSYYEKEKKIWTMDVSTWDDAHPTPLGRFKISTKSKSMLSKSAWKLMPYRMEFLDWIYWIHALPEDYKWNLNTTSTIWSEAAGWCVRLEKKDAKKLYEWAKKWTVVLISFDKAEYVSEDDFKVIKKYFEYINAWKYKEAYNLKSDKRLGFSEFKKIYKWLNIKIKSIEKNKNLDFIVKTEIYKNNKLIKRWIAVFQVSVWKIIKSYSLK
jgi:hypothetical protein